MEGVYNCVCLYRYMNNGTIIYRKKRKIKKVAASDKWTQRDDGDKDWIANSYLSWKTLEKRCPVIHYLHSLTPRTYRPRVRYLRKTQYIVVGP